MKRIYLFITFLLGSSVLLYFLADYGGPDYLPSDLLPESTVFYLEADEPVKRFEEFQQSKLGRQLAEIDWTSIGLELELPEQAVSDLKKQFFELSEFLKSSLCNELFSRKIALALLEPNENESLDINTFNGNFVLISNPRHPTSLLDALSSLFLKDLQFTTETYHGFTLKHFPLDNNNGIVSLAVVNDLFLVSLSSSTVKHCLDKIIGNVKQKNTSLSQNFMYTDLRAETGKDEDAFIYFNTDKAGSVLKYFAAYIDKPLQENIVKQIESMGVVAGSFFRKSLNGINEYTSVLKMNKAQTGAFKDLLEPGVVGKNRIIEFVPADLLLYYWTNWFEPQLLWRLVTGDNNKGSNEVGRKAEQWIQEATGQDLESMLNMFGKQFSFHVSGIGTSGFFPVPRMSFGFEVLDKEGVQKILKNLFAELSVEKNTISDVEVLSVMVAGGLMQPSFAFLDNCLLVSDSREQLAFFLNKKRKKLSKDTDFKKVDIGLNEPVNQVLFLRAEKLNDGLQQLVSWVGTIIAIRNIEAGSKSKIIVDRVIIPLLEGLKMYQLAGHRGFHKEDKIILQSAVVINQN